MDVGKDDDELLAALLAASSASNSKKKKTMTTQSLSTQVARYGVAGLLLITLVFWGVTLKDAAQEDDRELRSQLYNEELLASMDPTFVAQILEQQKQEKKKGWVSFLEEKKKKPKPPPTQTFAFDAVFGDNMVLQHGTKAAVYGFLGMQGCTSVKVDVVNAESKEQVFTTTKAMINATQQPFGEEWGVRPCSKADCPPYDMEAFNPWNSPLPTWKVLLPPQQPGGNFTISATCTSHQQGDGVTNETVITNITFGDMWYCSGQSNMWLPLRFTFHKNQTAKAILQGRYNNIRLMAGRSQHHPHGDHDWSTLNYGAAGGTNPWMQAVQAVNEQDFDKSPLFEFGAACWYFAQRLVDLGVTDVPIGLANTAIGGQRIQEFMNNATINQCTNRTSPGPHPQDPAKQQLWWESQLYATQVLPFADMTVKGFLWYQGENNMFDLKGNSAAHMGYSCEMKLMIEQWRALWSKTPGTTPPDAPFGLVTLASSGTEGGPDMGTMHLAQTANYGVLPNVDMPNTFLAQAYDLDDEWGPDLGACFDNDCCEDGSKKHFDPSKCNQTLHDLCNNPTGACAAHLGTPQFMGGIHPRSKKAVGDRLGIAAYNLLYGGKAAYTGPTLQGCSLLKDNDAVLEIRFNKTLLRGDSLAEPVIPPIVLKPVRRHPPAGGSMLFVQTDESKYCMESKIYYNGTGKKEDPFYFVCPEWAGGTTAQATNPVRNAYDDGWINVNFTLAPGTTNAIHVDLTPLGGAKPTAVRYAWGSVDCCDYSDPNLYVTHNCIANCPLQAAKSKLPANPWSTRIVDGHCSCVAPQVCSDVGYNDDGRAGVGAWE